MDEQNKNILKNLIDMEIADALAILQAMEGLMAIIRGKKSRIKALCQVAGTDGDEAIKNIPEVSIKN